MPVTSREIQKRYNAQGLCESGCGKPLNLSKCFCDPCLKKRRLSLRKRNGHKPWRKGFPGRPPLEHQA